MYRDALDFLEEERAAWAPYEALAELSDIELDRPTDPAGPGHGWCGRDLIGHMVFWQEHLLAVARELALGDEAPTQDRMREEWAARGDQINEELIVAWRELTPDEVRRRLRQVPGELRGYLTVVPEIRWLKHPERMAFVVEDTIEHYEEHRPELEAVLALAAGGGGQG
jgi:hypothetical protein